MFQHIFVKMKQKNAFPCILLLVALPCFGAGWCLGELGALGTEQVVALAVAEDVVQHDVAASLPRDVLIRRGWEGLKPQDGVLK